MPRSNRKRTSRRKRRARRLETNALSTKGRVLVLGGVTAALGIGAFLVFRGTASAQAEGPAPAPLPPGEAEAAARAAEAAAKSAECKAIQDQLIALKATATPSPTRTRELETDLATCYAAVKELGGDVDVAAQMLSDGDAKAGQVDGVFAEYRATDFSDAVKRNNTRLATLNIGEGMIANWTEALAQAKTLAFIATLRASLARAIEASRLRRDCYLFDQRGCGRFGVNEDHGNDKAAHEETRVLLPLVSLYDKVLGRLGGGASRRVKPYSAAYVTPMVASATTTHAYTVSKWNEYKATDYSDAIKRNNLRQVVLFAGELSWKRLDEARRAAAAHADTERMREVARAISPVIEASVNRWLCYILDQNGCGRFALNEDHGFDKAQQEYDRVMAPALRVGRESAYWLAQGNDYTLFTALIGEYVRWCRAIVAYADAKFGELKATDYSDIIKRDNVRAVIQSFAGLAALRLREAFEVARGVPSPSVTMMMMRSGSRTPVRLPTNKYRRPDAVMAAMRSVAAVMQTALAASTNRKICYLLGQSGCDRYPGSMEGSPVAKADSEQAQVTTPLANAYKAATAVIVGMGDTAAEVPMLRENLRFCAALKTYCDDKFNEFKATDRSDIVKRDNIRGAILDAARQLVECIRAIAPTTTVGRQEVLAFTVAAYDAAAARYLCFRSGTAECDRYWGSMETDAGTKAATELAVAMGPLGELVTKLGGAPAKRLPLVEGLIRAGRAGTSGLGSAFDGVSSYEWLALAGAAGVLLLLSGPSRVRSNRSRRRRMTSRRARELS